MSFDFVDSVRPQHIPYAQYEEAGIHQQYGLCLNWDAESLNIHCLGKHHW